MTTVEALTVKSASKRSSLRRRWAAEPLVHFFALGLGLFVIWGFFGESTDPSANRIVISTGQVARAIEAFARTHSHSPDAGELRSLVDDVIEDEIYFREGMALGLDKDDEIIRRRIKQKLLFMTEDMAAPANPSDAVLIAFLKAHAADYGGETQLVFSQIYIDPAHHKDPASDAEALLARLNAGDGRLDYAALSDTLPVSNDFEATPIHAISSLFGQNFGNALQSQPLGIWAGPVVSGYGLHLVLIRNRIDPKPPELSAVHDAVLRDWQAAKRQEINDQIYRALRAKYDVTVEMPRNMPSVSAVKTAGYDANE